MKSVIDTILKDIKPADCSVIILKKPSWEVNGSYYNFRTKTVFVVEKYDISSILKPLSRENFATWELLHEICHHLTWNPQWSFSFKAKVWYKNVPTKIIKHRTLYLCEYKAEKLCRQFCRQYGWDKILAESTNCILNAKHQKSRWVDNIYINTNYEACGYAYMKARIIREEKL